MTGPESFPRPLPLGGKNSRNWLRFSVMRQHQATAFSLLGKLHSRQRLCINCGLNMVAGEFSWTAAQIKALTRGVCVGGNDSPGSGSQATGLPLPSRGSSRKAINAPQQKEFLRPPLALIRAGGIYLDGVPLTCICPPPPDFLLGLSASHPFPPEIKDLNTTREQYT